MRRTSFLPFLVGALLFAMPARAQVPVTDAKSIALQTASWARQAADMIRQIAQLKDMLSLQYIASLALGPEAGAGWGDLISASQDLYSTSLNAYAGIMSVPGQIEQQIAVFQPPPGGWESATTPELLAKARAMQQLVSNTSAQTMGLQSKLIAQQAKAAQQQALTREQILSAAGEMQATQAAGLALVGIQQQLGDLQKTTTTIADLAAAKAAAEAASFGAEQAANKTALDNIKARVDAPAGRPELDPLPY